MLHSVPPSVVVPVFVHLILTVCFEPSESKISAVEPWLDIIIFPLALRAWPGLSAPSSAFIIVVSLTFSFIAELFVP